MAERPDLRTVEKLREDTSLRTIRFKWCHVSLGYVIKYAGHQVKQFELVSVCAGTTVQ